MDGSKNEKNVKSNSSMNAKSKNIHIGSLALSKAQVILGGTGVVLLALLGTYFGISTTYHSKFIKGTNINGVNVSEMNAHDASAALAKSAEKYSMEIKFREDKNETLTADQINFRYEPSNELQKLLDEQNRLAWLPGKMGLYESNKNVQAHYDEDKLKKVAYAYPELKKKNMKKPKDAYPLYEDGAFHVEPEYEGTKIKKKEFLKVLGEYVSAEEKEFVVEEEDGIYKEPKIREDDKTLNEQIPVLNDLCATSLTYDLWTGEKRVLDGNVLIKWLDYKDGKYTKNDEKWDENIDAFVEQLWEDVGTLYKPHKFKTHDGNEITVPGVGYYGYSLDKDKEISRLHKKDLKPGKTKEREPYYLQREAADRDDNYGFGGNYVEANLSEQMVYVYEDGECVFSTDCVSGLPRGGRMTPDGCYYAHDKQRNKTLRGAGYSSFVNYWIRLTGNGVGLHDATWRGSFGGSIWQSNGSHGCINLPYYAAATIYDMVPEGEPVVVYYE